ncbi:MAG: GIY-YIG nuclease family protein [Flavobacteriaceae bacterium]|nr:GIY-YIG nuclease family protein [Flavobacteriaceae bacterium]
MKVIFLDHDGVICLSDEWGGRFKKEKKFREETGILAKLSSPHYGLPVECRFDNFNKKAIDVLNEILETTGAEIVVSSDWKRWANVEEMGEYYLLQGIIKKPIIESKSGYIYVFQSSDSVFKIGRSKDLKKRLQTYQTGRSTDIILEYIYKTDHLNEVEGCLKALLKKNQYRKYKELYQVNLDIIKNVIHDCGKLSAKFAIKPNPGSYFAFIDYNEQNTFPERNNINIKKNSR